MAKAGESLPKPAEAYLLGSLQDKKKGAEAPAGPSKEPKRHQQRPRNEPQEANPQPKPGNRDDTHGEPRQAARARRPSGAHQPDEPPQTDPPGGQPSERKRQPDGETGTPPQQQSPKTTERKDAHRSQKSPRDKRTEKPRKH